MPYMNTHIELDICNNELSHTTNMVLRLDSCRALQRMEIQYVAEAYACTFKNKTLALLDKCKHNLEGHISEKIENYVIHVK